MEYKTKISEEEIEELPNFTFDGEIIVIDHEDKIDAAVNDLSSYSHIGFDTETKPAFKKGVTHQVGLLQLATDKRVYLFRLNKCGLSESLQDLLANENIMKIGVGIRDDIRGLRKLANFIPASFLDLQIFAKAFGIEEMSFSKLMSIIQGENIQTATDVKLGSPTIDPCTITLRSNRRMGGAKNVQGVKIRQQPATTSVLEFVK